MFVLSPFVDKIDQTISAQYAVTNIELEVRFINNSVKRTSFDRIKSFLQSRAPHQNIVSTDYFIDKNRVTKTGDEWISIRKSDKWHKKISEYNLKVAVSSEIKSGGDFNIENADFVREKDRTRFAFGDTYIDMTVVTRLKNKTPIKKSYEIEIEYNQESFGYEGKESLNNFLALTDYMIRLVNDTRIIYTNSLKMEVSRSVNSYLGSDVGMMGISKFASRARNLKRKDCVWGGLLRGESKEITREDGVKIPRSRYMITLKADGIRKFFYIHTNGIWLLSPPLGFNLIYEFKESDSVLRSIEGTLFDGEMIPKFHRRGNEFADVEYFYIPIDSILYEREDLREKTFIERLKYRDRFWTWFNDNQPLDSKLLRSYLKSYKLLEMEVSPRPEFAVKCFNDLVISMDDEDEKSPFVSDGRMFIPADTRYDTVKYGQVSQRDRVLSMHPDICKMKKWNQLTIDFLYKSDQGIAGLYVITDKGEELFTGTRFNQFNRKNVNWSSEMLKPENYGLIMEFEPTRALDRTIVMNPIKKRSDKAAPNPLRIAKDVWEDINRPFGIDSLKGETLDLVFQYHTGFKSRLLSEIPGGSDVIDLGAGRGGDINKLTHVNKVLAVEPNISHVEEYERRLSISKIPRIKQKFKVLNTVAEDSKTIAEAARNWFGNSQNNLYVISMLSLSFFWKDMETLNGLIRTLQYIRRSYPPNKEVTFIFVTIESSRTLRVIEEKGDKFTLGNGSFKFTRPNILDLHIEDSIVQNQTEYLVDLELLRNYSTVGDLNYKDLDPVEKFLTNDERLYNSMYVYGSFTIKRNEEQYDDYKIPLNLSPEEFKKNKPLPEGKTETLDVELEDLELEPGSVISRYGVIQDGISFIHSILTTSEDYRKKSRAEKIKYAQDYRQKLIQILETPNPKFKEEGLTYYESSEDYVEFMEGKDYKINLLESNLSYKYFTFISDVMNISFIIYGLEDGNLVQKETIVSANSEVMIAILEYENPFQYELITYLKDNKLQFNYQL